MDFSRECLDKNNEFGVLWFYGNKEAVDGAGRSGRILSREIEKLNLNNLFEFIRIHKNVIDYQHLSILFRGLFVIMFNRFELINRDFKSILVGIKNKNIRTNETSDFQLVLDDQQIDVERELRIEPPKTKSATKKSTERNVTAQKKKDTFIIDELPEIMVNDSLLTDRIDNNQLEDDGFGGNLSLNATANITDYFNLPELNEFSTIEHVDFDQPTSQPSSQPTSQPTSQPASQDGRAQTPPPQEYAQIADLPDFNLSPIGKASTSKALSSKAASPSLDTTLVPETGRDSQTIENLRASREGFRADRGSLVHPSFRSDLPSISERLPDRTTATAEQLDEQKSTSSSRSTLVSFNLLSLDEERPSRSKKNRGGLIIDRVIEYTEASYLFKNQKYHDNRQNSMLFDLAIPRLSVKDQFVQPLVKHSIDLSFYNPYVTERRSRDETPVEMQPIEMQRVEDESMNIGIEPSSRNVPAEMAVDESTGITGRFFSDFQQMGITSDYDMMEYDASSHAFNTRDLDSALPSISELRNDQTSRQAIDDDLRSVHSQMSQHSVRSMAPSLMSQRSYRSVDLNEITFSFVNQIQDALEKSDGELLFSEFTRDFKRREAAKCFADLLAMKMRREIELIQTDVTYYSEIFIRRV